MRSICYQREIREHEAAMDSRAPDTVLDYVITEIDAAEADNFIMRYEWLQTVGHPKARYGARNARGELAAVALFGLPAQTTAGDHLCGPEFGQFAIALERGACAHWAHPHTASWFIPRVCSQAARDHGWRIFFAYGDPEAGEIGTIYQAANWLYIGQTPDRLRGGKPRPRESFRKFDWPEGKWISDRAFFSHRGLTMTDVRHTRKLDGTIVPGNPDGEWERVDRPAKHKYVRIEGTWTRDDHGRWRGPKHSERAELLHLLTLRHPPQPYPKRASHRYGECHVH